MSKGERDLCHGRAQVQGMRYSCVPNLRTGQRIACLYSAKFEHVRVHKIHPAHAFGPMRVSYRCSERFTAVRDPTGRRSPLHDATQLNLGRKLSVFDNPPGPFGGETDRVFSSCPTAINT